MSKITTMYYDAFANEYCLPSQEELNMGPPERYIKTHKGDDLYIEHWIVSGSRLGDRLDIAYRMEDYRSREEVTRIKRMTQVQHGIRLSQLISWTIPAVKFDEYVEMFGLDQEKNNEHD